MTEWPVLELGAYPVEIIDGDRGAEYPKTADFTPSGYCLFLNAGNVTANGFAFDQCAYISEEKDKKLRKGRLLRNDTVATTRGTVGNFAFYDRSVPMSNIRINSGMVILRPDQRRVDPRFLYFAVRSPLFGSQIKSLTSGSAQPQLPIRDMKKLRLPLPPIQEQRSIVDAIGSLDDKIKLNRRMNETLEAITQAIFRDWFVDFGPTRRKLEGATDPITIMGSLVLDAERAQVLAELFPAELGNDGLPEGWAHRPFGSLLSDTIGGDWGKDTSQGENAHPVAIIRGTDFPELEVGGVGKVPTRYTTAKKAVRRKLLPSDILIEVSGGSPTQPTGRSIFITQSVLDRFNSDVVCASFCRRFRAISHNSAVLAFEHLRNLYSEGGTWEYQNQSTGISNFQTTHFLEAEKVVFPGDELMEHFASLSGPMIEARYRNESMTLAATRDLLLPKLMSGEIRLSEAEDLVEAAQ